MWGSFWTILNVHEIYCCCRAILCLRTQCNISQTLCNSILGWQCYWNYFEHHRIMESRSTKEYLGMRGYMNIREYWDYRMLEKFGHRIFGEQEWGDILAYCMCMRTRQGNMAWSQVSNSGIPCLVLIRALSHSQQYLQSQDFPAVAKINLIVQWYYQEIAVHWIFG